MPSIELIVVGILLVTLLASVLTFKQKTKKALLLLGRFGIRVCIVALLLFLFNQVGEWFDFRIAINPITVSFVAILGVPGMLSLVVLTYLFV